MNVRSVFVLMRRLAQHTFHRYPAKITGMVACQGNQLFDSKIIILPYLVPRVDDLSVADADAAVTSVDQAVLIPAKTVIEDECAALRLVGAQGILIHIAGFPCGIAAEDLDIVADLQCILRKGKAPTGVPGIAHMVFLPSDHTADQRLCPFSGLKDVFLLCGVGIGVSFISCIFQYLQ